MNNQSEAEKQLTYEEFVEKMRGALSIIFGPSYNCELIKQKKTDAHELDTIAITKVFREPLKSSSDEQHISTYSVNVYTEEEYRNYLEGEKFGDVMRKVVASIERTEGHGTLSAVVQTITDLYSYEGTKDRLIIRAIGYETSKEMLKDFVFRKIGDIALVLYALTIQEAYSMASMKVSKTIAGDWGVSFDEALDAALRNTQEKFPPRLMPLEELIAAGLKIPSKNNDFNLLDPGFRFKRSRFDTYLFTDSHAMNGATAFFYPGIQQKLGELFFEDYYMVPTSIKEVMLHPVSTTKLAFVREQAAASSNDMGLKPEEILSKSVYKYTRSLDKLAML
ncbi:MAG: DUF5688 family protein [Clostridiales bacterium]|jgi:hypothetical protein|nr:DUF5688 family protein [Clostridiales bacterium]